MGNKRNNTLVSAVEIAIENGSVSAELAKELLKEYKSATYAEYSDRHEWYREKVGEMINDCGFREGELAEAMVKNHPTLQQNFMRLCVKFIEGMSKKTYWDARNEKSVKLAKAMLSEVGEDGTGLPFI